MIAKKKSRRKTERRATSAERAAIESLRERLVPALMRLPLSQRLFYCGEIGSALSRVHHQSAVEYRARLKRGMLP